MRTWVREYKNKTGWQQKHEQQKKAPEETDYKTPTDYENELKEREKEISRLAEENEILKKAMHVFTKNRE